MSYKRKGAKIFKSLLNYATMKSKTFFILLLILPLYCTVVQAQTAQMEKLDRALTAVQTPDGVFLSWRALITDSPQTNFDLYRNGRRVNKKPLTGATNLLDAKGNAQSVYTLQVFNGRRPTDECYGPVPVWKEPYQVIPTDCPQGGGEGRTAYEYHPNDCSTGDVDGDGEYEIILKWDPTNSQDNSRSGFTGNVYIDCYKMSGKKLWRIDLGRNIRAGAHYTQLMVYDLDGDGRAEVACKTAPGTIDGTGHAVLLAGDDATADYRGERGHVLRGPEYLTVFNGLTGAQMATLPYTPSRDVHCDYSNQGDCPRENSWGDGNGNRSERYLACIAYLDGIKPSLVMCRGYYTFSHLTAYDFDGKSLKMRWSYSSPYRAEAYGQGAHNLSVADVDGDGCDEIIYGSATIDHNGTCLYTTGLGHGDALHVSDLDPDIEGLEVFMPHEARPCGYDLHRAATGEILLHETSEKDNGRGLAADIDSRYRGSEFWSAASPNVYSCKGKVISTHRPPINFRIYWDGDLQDELFDHSCIYKWMGDSTLCMADFGKMADANCCNGTKSTPCLQADLLGDWREELLLWQRGSNNLLLFTTTIPTPYRVVTPMQDHIYRMGIAWQNTAYNQPPHLGYWLGGKQ